MDDLIRTTVAATNRLIVEYARAVSTLSAPRAPRSARSELAEGLERELAAVSIVFAAYKERVSPPLAVRDRMDSVIALTTALIKALRGAPLPSA